MWGKLTSPGMALLFVGMSLLTGCTSGDGTSDSAVKIVADPPVDARDVSVLAPVKITVSNGSLTEATVTNSKGKPVAGSFAPDKLSWLNTEPLDFKEKYSYAATAIDDDGNQVRLTGSFATVTPAKLVRATVNPVDGDTVGVAMPISVTFESAPKDRVAAERALSVTTSPTQVEGAWAWLDDKQVDWRPREYWPSGTKVKVTAKLYGIHYGAGAYGRASVTSHYSIGRNQVVKLHTPSHEMVVERDGEEFTRYPASFGEDANPDLNTPNGTLIVMSKSENERFDNPQYGYTNVWKRWAVRISNHGEYIHENEDNRGNIGVKNTSHGCVNLTESDAKHYFDTALVGDPVEVTGSSADMPTWAGVNDWLFDWKTWKSMSALKGV